MGISEDPADMFVRSQLPGIWPSLENSPTPLCLPQTPTLGTPEAPRGMGWITLGS
jgi:hypothetical protein